MDGSKKFRKICAVASVTSALVFFVVGNYLQWFGNYALLKTKQSDSLQLSISDNPEVQFGKLLFFDSKLSQNQTISCASCHHPDQAFSSHDPRSIGIDGKIVTRNAPSLLTATFSSSKFWDGRRDGLLNQVLDPFTNPLEHGLKDQQQLIQIIQSDPRYREPIQIAFSKKPAQLDIKDLATALASYIQSIAPQNTRVHRFFKQRDENALTQSERLGLEVFRGKGACSECHLLTDTVALTDGRFHLRGIGFAQLSVHLAELINKTQNLSVQQREYLITSDPQMSDLGRFMVTLNVQDIGKFKTPSLWEVKNTAPYMHDGSIASLEQAVDWELYYRNSNSQQPILLSDAERSGLLDFLSALNATPELNKL